MATACEPENDGVADRWSTATVALTGTDGRDDAGNGGVSYGIDNAASKTACKSEVRESNRHDASGNERSDQKSDKKNESSKKNKSDRKHGSEKEDRPEQEGKSHKKGESDKRESGRAGSGSSERLASHNYCFDDDDDEIVTSDETFVGKDDSVTVAKTHDGVARIFSNGGIIRVEGDVKEIDVYRSDIGVVADLVTEMKILGSDVDVLIRGVSSVRFDGFDNDMRWTDDPILPVTDNGVENEIRRARPAPAR